MSKIRLITSSKMKLKGHYMSNKPTDRESPSYRFRDDIRLGAPL